LNPVEGRAKRSEPHSRAAKKLPFFLQGFMAGTVRVNEAMRPTPPPLLKTLKK